MILESIKFQLVLCEKSTGLCKYIWVKIDRWEKLARPCQSHRDLCCVCQWKNTPSCITKIRVFYSKMKTRNQRVRISLLVSHPVCHLIKGYSWLPATQTGWEGKVWDAQFIPLQLPVGRRGTLVDTHDLTENGAKHNISNLNLWHSLKHQDIFKHC